ncbi:MAG TPA: class I SAM-dependent methyltransferase [Longimicrobium sp.]|nr:class I SAM-dependent methyltransferase [Longimicrobium sp.]
MPACWVCGGAALAPVHTALFELSEYARQDPALARYTGATVRIVRCASCGFGQPEALPSLPDFFGRMYDQRWSAEWMETEYTSGYKDLIFRTVLKGLEQRLRGRRTLLDLGAHVGRLMHVAAGRGWAAEGVELNPSTAAHAAKSTGLPVHRMDARELSSAGRRWAAVTLIDVLEHIPEPVAALRSAIAVLEPGGWIAVKVPHGREQLRKEMLRARLSRAYRATVADNLVHVNHFGVRSLTLALERAGFAEVRVEIAAPEVMPAVGAKRALSNAVRLSTWHLGRILPRGVESPLSLHLQAYARKP